ncbi:MAG: carbohydrate ABC transporter permease, partial [Lachnospiraceae bacterium]|nr:carbohydrate ABC transporter permease [Lachnospiraceae bacterium]
MGEGRQVGKGTKIRAAICTVVGVIVAVYVLFPFYLVLLNAFKNQASIVANPISFVGTSIKQLMTNLVSVVNNTNFNFWYAFGTSAVITVISRFLLAL